MTFTTITKGNGKGNNKNQDGNQTLYIPFIPKCLYSSLDVCAKNNLTKWRKCVNHGGSMDWGDLIFTNDDDDDDSKNYLSNNSANNNPKNNGKNGHKITKCRRVSF